MPENSSEQKTTKGSAAQIQNTRTVSKRVTEDELLNAIGASGTYIVNGYLEGDYNSKLSGAAGLTTYDRMRKSDAQVHASLQVCVLPILSTGWYIEAAKNEDGETGEAEQEVADFVKKALFDRMEIDWQSYLSEVLTLLPFGFSLFEKVYTADDDNEYIWLKKLAIRKQTTIEKWEMEDGGAGVTQQLPSTIEDPTSPSDKKSTISIPASKLLLFSLQKEGDNYVGVSVLRSAYRHWFIKDKLYSFDAVKHERQGVGIPCIKLPKGHTEKDKAEARSILKNIRANEQGGVILPNPEWEFFFADLQAGNTSDMWKSIDHHNREIAKNVLAQFLELGNTESGSRALSEDQSDFFLLSLEALANLIEEVHNRFLIHELVDLNFTVTEYPKLRHKKLGSVDYGTISNVLSTLVGAGIIEADDDLEDWARKTIDAPAKMIEEEPEEEEETEEGEEDEGTDPLTGEPIDPEDTTNPETPSEIDPETGEPVLPEEETEDAEDVTEGQDDGTEDIPYQVGDEGEPILDENGNYIDDEGNPIDEEGNPVDEDGNPLEASEFRAPVSEETKKKISEALKKNGGGKVDLKKVRTMRRQQRLAKRAKTSKRPAAKAPKAAKVPKMAKKAPKTAGARSLRRNASKRKAGRIAKRAGKTVKKPAAKKPSAPIGQRAKQQKNDPNSPLFKKKVLAHEHEQDEYDLIFAEGAKKIMMMQELVEFTKRDLPGGAQKFAELPATWRPYTFAEQKVNWPSLKSSVSKFQKALDTEVADITANQKADLLAQVRRAVEKNDIAGVGKIKAKYTGDLSSALTNVQKEMFEIGKSSISKEMGVATPNTASEVLGAMRVSNGKLSQKLTSDMENAAADAVSQTIMKKGGSISGTGTAEAVGQASAAIDRVLKQTGKINTLTLYGSLNLGRAAVYERYPEKVYAMQYSAIIDDVTTDRCLSLDGRVVKAGSPDYYSYGPPQHYECRSIWVEILEDEEFKPDTEEIPSKIPSTTTIDNVTELSAPVVTPNSPAIKSLQAEIDERKAKVEEYKASGQYQNRIALHQSRIDALEKAIGE